MTANLKMKTKVTNFVYKNSLLTKLLTPHLSYDQRVKMAKDEQKLRR